MPRRHFGALLAAAFSTLAAVPAAAQDYPNRPIRLFIHTAPSYSVQPSHLKKGTVDHAAKAWSTYGGRVGVWRLMRTFDRLGVLAMFFVNARCTEQYPDAVKQIVKSGFDIAAHSYTQDDLPAYFPPHEQGALIRRSIDLLEGCGGKKVTGWGSPVVAFTPETAGLLKQNSLKWTCDVICTDLPIRIHTPHGRIAGVPTTDFSDNRVLRTSARDLYDVHRGMFDYLRQSEPIGLQTLVIHRQFGGRPLIAAVLTELIEHIQKSRDAWFTTHEKLADWALAQNIDEHTYQSRYFS